MVVVCRLRRCTLFLVNNLHQHPASQRTSETFGSGRALPHIRSYKAPPSPRRQGFTIFNKCAPSPSPTTNSHGDVDTVFSEVLKDTLPDAASRKTLSMLKSSLSSAQAVAEVESVLSRSSARLLKHPEWLFLLNLLRYSSKPAKALQVFDWKRKQPNSTFSSREYALIIHLAGRLGILEKAKALYKEMPSRGVHRTVEVENAYMLAHACDKNIECVELLKVLEGLRGGKDSDFTPSFYSKVRHLQHLEKTFDKLIGAGFSSSLETYNCLMLAYLEFNMWWRMEEIFCSMRDAPVKPNALTYRTLIRGYAGAGLIDRMEGAMEEMLKSGFPFRETTAKAVVTAYKKAREFGKVEKILFRIRTRRAWSSMSRLRVRHAERMPMEEMVDKLMRSGDVPFSPVLSVIVIKAYLKTGELKKIEDFLESADAYGWYLSRLCYNALIYLFAEHGLYAEMEWCIKRMLASRCRPNKRTFDLIYNVFDTGRFFDAANDLVNELQATMSQKKLKH